MLAIAIKPTSTGVYKPMGAVNLDPYLKGFIPTVKPINKTPQSNHVMRIASRVIAAIQGRIARMGIVTNQIPTKSSFPQGGRGGGVLGTQNTQKSIQTYRNDWRPYV
ncbi:hypothetical protein G9A89_000715 [Geosiphon pyriformis]|nr:hypothetical protein G9A89_000715 [Geosiphon pyriformis]